MYWNFNSAVHVTRWIMNGPGSEIDLKICLIFISDPLQGASQISSPLTKLCSLDTDRHDLWVDPAIAFCDWLCLKYPHVDFISMSPDTIEWVVQPFDFQLNVFVEFLTQLISFKVLTKKKKKKKKTSPNICANS